VSVVVIGRNEGGRLRRCLESVEEMQAPAEGVEVVYVDSGSTDGSAQMAAEMGARVVRLESGRFTAGRARDAGWREARAAFVFFVDGDTVVAPRFAVQALEEFRDERVGVVFGRTRELHANRSVFHRAFDLQWRTFPLGAAETSMGTALMRRSAIEAAGGYDPEIPSGEDAEICGRIRRKGFTIRGVDLPMVAHDLTMTRWGQYWWRMVRNGYGLAEVTDRFAPEEMRLLRSRVRHAWVWGVLTPLLAPVAGVAVLVTAWKTYRATGERWSALVFAVHTYLKEVPRMIGQMRYRWDKRRGQRTLIEYKTGSRRVHGA